MHPLRFVALIAVFAIPLAGLALIDKALVPLADGVLASSDAESARHASTDPIRLR